jgi:hypothetical protein
VSREHPRAVEGKVKVGQVSVNAAR